MHPRRLIAGLLIFPGLFLAACHSSRATGGSDADTQGVVCSVPMPEPLYLTTQLAAPRTPDQPEARLPLRAELWTPVLFPNLPAKLPLIVFLHGSGESGVDGAKQTTVGLGAWAKKNPLWFPAVILMPQKPEQWRLWPDHESQVLDLIARVSKGEGLSGDRQIDPDRIIITGLSQGGHGTWSLLKARPELFAAGVPVCGWGTERTYAGGLGFGDLGNVPIWVFHGERDDVVPAESSRGLVDRVRAARAPAGSTGGEFGVKLTVFPEANHNSWDPAYGDKALADWMMLQRRQR